jgi:hypothetical protein
MVGLPPSTATLGIVNPNSPENGVTLPTYPQYTLSRVSISGLTTVTYLPTGEQSTLDARGRFAGGVYNACYEGVAISFSQSGDVDFGACPDGVYEAQETLSKYVIVLGQGSAWWTGGRPHASDECGGGPCRSYVGDKQIVIEPVQADFTVTAAPTAINFQDTVTVTAGASPGQVGGLNMPFTIDSTKWAPAFGTQVPPCGWTDFVWVDPGTRTCHKPFTRSGTLTVFATVNGAVAQQAVSVTVTPPTLDVTATPTTTTGPDSVTFTATVTPSSIAWNLSSWTWVPDSGTGGLSAVCNWFEKTCKRLISRSGWMKAAATLGEYVLADSVHVKVDPPQLRVTAAPTSIQGPQDVTFTATLTPNPPNGWDPSWAWRADSGTGGISAVCNWWEVSCTRTCSKSGWMKATTTIGEYALADSAHVSVVPCLTNDSILDDSRIRRKLAEAWNNSNSNAPANQRVERFGMRVRLPNGAVVDTNFLSLPGATPCQAYDPAAFDPSSVGDVILTWHTHPFEPAHYGPGVGWVISTPAELLPYPGCAVAPNIGAAPEPSPSDRNHTWPQIIIDKTNAYWIEHPATDISQIMNVKWRTVRRSQCDVMTYN